MKKFNLLITLLIFVCNVVFSQVGVNTDDPTKTLDINGELRIRTVPSSTTVTKPLFIDNNGNVLTSDRFSLVGSATVSATSPVEYTTAAGSETKNDIDIGLSLTVFIPANTTALVVINYSVPIGLSDFTYSDGYYGIRFLKDNIEYPQGSRKFSIFFNDTDYAFASMVSVSNVVSEEFAPIATDRTIVYKLNGYIEELDYTDSHTFRFNMWDVDPNPNYNWGRSTMTSLVFYK